MRFMRFTGALAALLLSAVTAAAQTAPSNADICRADVNGNLVVDAADSKIVNAAYRSRVGQRKFNPRVDFDGDGAITLADRTFVTTKMGKRCVIAPVNRPPTFTSSPLLVASFGIPYAYLVTATDPDGDQVTFTLRQGPQGLTLVGAQVSWTPGVVAPQDVTIEAADGKGGLATQQYRITVAPPAPPTVSLTTPQTGLLTRMPSQVATGSVSDRSVTSGVLRVNGIDQPLVIANGQFSAPVTLVEGANRLVASASNAGGTGTSADIVVTLDSSGPTLEARMPRAVGAGDRVELLAEVFDRSGVVSVTMQVNGAPGGTLSRLPYAFSVVVPDTLAKGAQLPLTFSAVDTLGNTRTVERALVVETPADTLAPSVALSMPSTAAPGEVIPVTMSAEDDRGVTELTLLRGAAPLRQVGESPFAVQHPFTVPADATPGQMIELNARAEDAAGNAGTTAASVLVVLPTVEETALRLTLNPVTSPTFQPSQVISGSVGSAEVQVQHRPRAFVGSLSLTEGRQGERLQVQVVGVNSSFADGNSTAVFGAGVVVNSVTVQSPTALTADITIASDASIGPRLVSVQTLNEEALLLNAFNVRSGVGTVTGRLRDAQGQALAGVEVCVPGSALCVVTNAAGNFTIEGAPSTARRVSVMVPGLNQVSVPVALTVGGNATLGDIAIDTHDIPPPPPPPGGPQPPPAIAKLLGLGLGDATAAVSIAKAQRLVTDAFIAAGGSEAGVLDETGRQLNPEVAGTGLVTLLPTGVRLIAQRMERGETMALGDMLFAWSFGFVWTANPPRLTDWLEVMQARVDAAWANPSDPSSVLPILVFNRDRVLTSTAPRLAPDMRLGPVQAALLTTSFFGAMLPEAAEFASIGSERPVLVAAAAEVDVNAALRASRAWWRRDDARPVSDSGVPGVLAAGAARAQGNTRRLTGFWRNAFAAKNTFVTQTLNNVFQAELKLMMAMALPAMAHAGLLSTAINVAVAASYIGPISNFVQGAYGAVRGAMQVPEPPEIREAAVKIGADGVAQVHVEFPLSRSHVQPTQDSASGQSWAYTLYRFRASDSARELVDYAVITPDSTVPVRTLGGTVERLVSAISELEFRNNVVLTLTDRQALPLVEDAFGQQVRAATASWFYAVTVTRFRGASDGVRADQLANAVPWWNYPLSGRFDPGGMMALHTKAQHMLVSDYSAPEVVTVNANGVQVRSDGLEIDPKTGLAYYSDTKSRQIFRVDLGLVGSRQLFTVPNFKNAQNGLAIDSDGSLYSNNEASNAEFGGRIFRFTQPQGTRDHVGGINYYSLLLQFAHPASASAMTMGPGSLPAVSVEDLFLVDDLAQVVKRVPVRAAFDPLRRIGQPWATLPFAARSVDFEFHTPGEGSDDRPDGVLLVDSLPSAGLSVTLDVADFVALGDSVTARVRIGNPGQQAVNGVRPILSFTGEGELRQVTAPPAPVALPGGGGQDYEFELNAAGSGVVTMRVLGQGADAGGVTVSSPPVERKIDVRPPLAIEISAPRQAAPGALFEVLVNARNRSNSVRLVDVTPAMAMFDPTIGGLDVLGEAVLVTGPLPATLALDPGATGSFRYEFRGTRMGRVGLEARATAKTAGTQVPMSAGPEKANVNITPLTVELRVPPGLKKDAVFEDAAVVFHNTSLSPVDVTPVLDMSGLGRVEVVGPTPFGALVTVPAQSDLTLTFDIKGVRRGLAQLEALGRIQVGNVIFNTDRDTERVSVGPTITGVVSDVGFRALSLAYDENLVTNGFARLGTLAGLTVVADDGQGSRAETVTGDDGRYVLALENGGPYSLIVVHPGRNVGVTIRDQVVPLDKDVLTKDIDLPVTLVTQARSLGLQMQRLPLGVDHEKVSIVTLDQANVTPGYEEAASSFLSYLERFQQGAATPLFEYPLKAAEDKELSEWHSLIRSTLLLAFTKRRFDEAATISGPFVKLVVDYVVSKIGIDKVGGRFDATLQNGINNTFFRVPENSSLAKDLADTKIDFDKVASKADEIQRVLLQINGVICPYFNGLIDFAEAQGDAIEAKDRERLLAKCDEATKTAKAVITGVMNTLKLTLSGGAVDAVTNAIKTEGMKAGVGALMTRYVSLFTQPVLVGELHRAERTLEFRGGTQEVVRSLRELDNETRTEVNRLFGSISGHGEVNDSVAGFLKSAASTIDKNLLQHLKDGAGVLGKILTVLTNLDMMTLFGEATVLGPGKVCRASNQVFRADAAAAFSQEPPTATLFCVQDLPHDH